MYCDSIRLICIGTINRPQNVSKTGMVSRRLERSVIHPGVDKQLDLGALFG